MKAKSKKSGPAKAKKADQEKKKSEKGNKAKASSSRSALQILMPVQDDVVDDDDLGWTKVTAGDQGAGDDDIEPEADDDGAHLKFLSDMAKMGEGGEARFLHRTDDTNLIDGPVNDDKEVTMEQLFEVRERQSGSQ